MIVLRWIFGLAAGAVLVGGPIVWSFILGLACAFGSPNGGCPSTSEGFFNEEAFVIFWVPWLLALCVMIAVIRGTRLGRVGAIGLGALAVLLIGAAVALSLPRGI